MKSRLLFVSLIVLALQASLTSNALASREGPVPLRVQDRCFCRTRLRILGINP
jgi:hypothetical protein